MPCREAISDTGRVAVSRVVIGQRERTIALMPTDGGLVAHTLDEQRATMLSDIQQKAMSHADRELGNSLELVDYISQVGFRLVDEMEGVVR